MTPLGVSAKNSTKFNIKLIIKKEKANSKPKFTLTIWSQGKEESKILTATPGSSSWKKTENRFTSNTQKQNKAHNHRRSFSLALLRNGVSSRRQKNNTILIERRQTEYP